MGKTLSEKLAELDPERRARIDAVAAIEAERLARQREYRKAYYEANRERIRAKARDRYNTDKDIRARILSSCAASREKRRAKDNDKYLQAQRESRAKYRAANLEKLRAAGRAYWAKRYAADPAPLRARSKAWIAKLRAEDPEKFKELGRRGDAAKRAKGIEQFKANVRAREAKRFAENPDKVRKQRRDRAHRYRANNPDKTAELDAKSVLARQTGVSFREVSNGSIPYTLVTLKIELNKLNRTIKEKQNEERI